MKRSVTHPLPAILLGLALLVTPAFADDGIEIRGQVVDDDGRPVAKAAVELRPLPSLPELGQRTLSGQDPAPVAVSTRTGGDGGFRIGAPEGGMWQVVVRHPGHLEMACDLRPAVEPVALETVTLPRRLERRLRTVDEDGRPVPGVHVAVQGFLRDTDYLPPFLWQSAPRYGTSDRDGRVTVATAAEETLRLVALAGNRLGHGDFGPGSGDVTLRLAERIDARVVDEGGRPAANLVALFGGRFPIGATDAKGKLRIPLVTGRGLYFVDTVGFVGRARSLTAEAAAEPPVVLRLPAMAEVDGRVIDAASREPVAGAWIRMADDFQRSDRQGGFRLRVPRTGAPDWIEVAAPGYLVERPDPSPAKLPGGELVVALTPTLALEGRVVDEDGEGVAGAEIRARPLPQRGAFDRPALPVMDRLSAVVARSRTGGEFRLAGLRPANGYELRVRHPGHAPRRVDVPGLDPAAVPESLEIVLAPGIEAFGTVVDADGLPVAGAAVSLTEEPDRHTVTVRRFGGRDAYGTVAGSNGRFSFSDLPPGTFELEVRASGLVPRTLSGMAIRPGSPDLGTIALEPAIEARGRVTDADGAGIAGARVSVSSSRPPVQATVVTGADGSFTLGDLPPDTALSISVSAKGFVRQHVVSEPDRPFEVVLETSRVLIGRVVDADGEGVAAHVQFDVPQPGGGRSALGHGTDPDGRFRLAANSVSEVTIRAGNAAGVAEALEVKIPEEGGIPEVRVVLRPAAVLHGRVTDPGGAPVIHAHVALDPLFQSGLPDSYRELSLDVLLTDAEGRFTVLGLEGGSYRLRLEHPELEPLDTRVEIAAGVTEEIDVAFTERRDRDRSKVSGRVVGDGGAGIDGAVIQLVADSPWNVAAETLSFGDGRFELAAPEPGSYSLVASFGDLAPGRTEPFRAGDGAVEDVVLHLVPGAAVRGRILGLGSDELAGVEIAAYAPAYGSVGGRVSPAGRFFVSGLAAGSWNVTANHPESGRSVSEGVHLGGPGDEVEVELRFPQGFRLTGRVVMDGVPLADGEVQIRCFETRMGARVGIHDGRFVHDGVPAGSCSLSVRDRRLGVRTARRTVEIAGDTDVALEFATAVLSGRVASRGGFEPVAGAVVQLHGSESGSLLYTTTGSDGRFEAVVESGRAGELWVTAAGFVESGTEVFVEGPGLEVEVLIEPTAEDPTAEDPG
jgi:protocatechuate 3,4-dioxygenase beta subunit